MKPGSDRTRLLMVSSSFWGGVPQHVRDLVECIDPARWRVEVACPWGGQLWQALEGRPGVLLHAIPSGTGIGPADILPWLRLLRLVRRADITHAHSSKAGFLARSAAMVTGRTRRCAFTPHAWSFLAFPGWKGGVLVAAERLVSHWCAVIVAVSDDERVAGLRRGVGRPAQYRLIQNGVDVSRFSAGPHRREPERILVISRLNAQKRPALAIEALVALRQSRPGATLVFAGDGPLRPGLEETVARAALGGAVEFLGHVDDVAGELSRASCLLLTSSYEGCPLSVLEAMAAGVPVVATRAVGTAGLIEHGVTGLLVDDGPAAIAAALDRVLAYGTATAETVERARAVVHRDHARERMAGELLSAYAEMLGRSGEPSHR